MTIEEGLTDLLLNDSAVAALVSDRIVPQQVAQDTALPAIAYQRISGPRSYALDGATGAAMARVQITFLAGTLAGASALAEAVRAAMSGYRGTMGTVTVDACFLENEHDTYAQTFERQVVRHDYMIAYQES